ncbi:tight adherence protein B [Marininema mesophilum]|uniref:Tight adherence protein B n=1 Tax=Marininema mesophilum TaxID=1048340 RepID=A0A1H2X4K0_9BACL|nr:type II secretion system F family protein [Marininema mesophilum]SDW87745.1 tight adherence protein B [Marininema mesophilum]
MSALLIAGAAACAIWALHYYLLLSNERKKAHDKLNDWMYKGLEKSSWSDSLADRVDGTEWAKKMRVKLDQASLDLKPSDYGSFLAMGLIGMIFIMNMMVGIESILVCVLISIVTVPVGSTAFLRSRQHIYAQRLDNQLSEACRLLSSAARAGLSIPQGLQLVVQEMPSPIKVELGRVVREIELGKDLEESVRDLQQRVNTNDIQVFANALIIQRRAGGDLARVMSEMASTMEERKIIHQTIRAVTAQARTSAYALPAISILIALMLSKMIDGFWELMSSLPGMIILGVFGLLQVLGVVLVKKFSQIRV